MEDLHNPNNPYYDKQEELTRELIYEKLTNEEINFLDDEMEYFIRKEKEYTRRIVSMKKEMNDLIEVLEQTDRQAYVINKLKKITEL